MIQLTFIILLIPYCFFIRAMPLLLMLSSLQLMAYLPLLSYMMPPEIVLTLTPYLNLVRFKIPNATIDFVDGYD